MSKVDELSIVIKKIWSFKYVVGNPAMFSRVTSCADNPMARSEALAAAGEVANYGGGWRVWGEREDTGKRKYRAAQAA